MDKELLADLRDGEGAGQFEENHIWTVSDFGLDLIEFFDTVGHFGIIAHETGLVLKVVSVEVNNGEEL